MINLKRCIIKKLVISYTIAILNNISRRFINKIHSTRLFSSINVRRRFLEIESNLNNILVIRRCNVLRVTSYVFATTIEVEN